MSWQTAGAIISISPLILLQLVVIMVRFYIMMGFEIFQFAYLNLQVPHTTWKTLSQRRSGNRTLLNGLQLCNYHLQRGAGLIIGSNPLHCIVVN